MQLYWVWENLQIYNAAHAKRQTKWKQDIKVATNNNKKASNKCPEMATEEELYKTFLELHIQRFKFYSFIIYTSYLYYLQETDLDSPSFK